MAIAGDDKAGDVSLPVVFDRPRHGRRRLAGSDHQRAASGRRGQESRHALLRQGRRDCRVEKGPEKSLGF